jgi:recombination protein RecA
LIANKLNKDYGQFTAVTASDLIVPKHFTTGSLSVNVITGGGFPGNAWSEIRGIQCLAPGTKILTTNLVWKNIEDLVIGEEIIGFDEQQQGMGKGNTSKFRRAQITHLGKKSLPSYKIVTNFGETLASEGHYWLVKHVYGSRTSGDHSQQRRWVRTDSLIPGMEICSIGPTWEDDKSYEAGWLAGFYDGEGCISASEGVTHNNGRLSCGQAIGPIADKAMYLISNMGFNINSSFIPRRQPHYKDKIAWKLGGRYEDMRFVGSIRPERLIEKSHYLWENVSTKSVHSVSAVVKEIAFEDYQEVITIETTTKTLIADGMLSHNSAGKTSFMMKAVAANQRQDPDFTTLWVAAEAYDSDQAQALGVDNSRVTLVPTQQMELAFQVMVDAAESREVDMIILDSYPALVPDEEAEKAMDEFTTAVGARGMNKFVRKAGLATRRAPDGSERPVTGIIINQYRDKVGGFAKYGVPQTTPGGHGKDYFYHLILKMSRDSWLEEKRPGVPDAVKVGQSIKLVTEKNKSAAPQQTVSLNFYFRNAPLLGFSRGEYDTSLDYFTMASIFGIIEKRGGWYYFNDQKWQGKPAVLRALHEDIELRDILEELVMSAASNPSTADALMSVGEE